MTYNKKNDFLGPTYKYTNTNQCLYIYLLSLTFLQSFIKIEATVQELSRLKQTYKLTAKLSSKNIDPT